MNSTIQFEKMKSTMTSNFLQAYKGWTYHINTLDIENQENAAKVFVYWMRTEGFPDTMQPVDLVDVMVKYYHIARFAWDSERVDGKLILSNERLMVSKRISGTYWGSVCSENVLSADAMSTA